MEAKGRMLRTKGSHWRECSYSRRAKAHVRRRTQGENGQGDMAKSQTNMKKQKLSTEQNDDDSTICLATCCNKQQLSVIEKGFKSSVGRPKWCLIKRCRKAKDVFKVKIDQKSFALLNGGSNNMAFSRHCRSARSDSIVCGYENWYSNLKIVLRCRFVSLVVTGERDKLDKKAEPECIFIRSTGNTDHRLNRMSNSSKDGRDVAI
nr:hypothetical protein Iba_chr03dCG2730 [Ipomoea batatas]